METKTKTGRADYGKSISAVLHRSSRLSGRTLFDPSTMVLFRKRINAQMIAKTNEYMLSNLNKKDNEDDNPKPPTGGGRSNNDSVSDGSENKETLLELPRRYAKRVRRDYLSFVKHKKHTTKKSVKPGASSLHMSEGISDISMNS